MTLDDHRQAHLRAAGLALKVLAAIIVAGVALTILLIGPA